MLHNGQLGMTCSPLFNKGCAAQRILWSHCITVS